MSEHHRMRLLRMMCERPRRMRDFTDGTEGLQVMARHVQAWLDVMVADGLVLYTTSDEYRITMAGREKLREETTVASPRTNPMSAEPWKPKPWIPARAGAMDFKKHRSVGIDAGSPISTDEVSS